MSATTRIYVRTENGVDSTLTVTKTGSGEIIELSEGGERGILLRKSAIVAVTYGETGRFVDGVAEYSLQLIYPGGFLTVFVGADELDKIRALMK